MPVISWKLIEARMLYDKCIENLLWYYTYYISVKYGIMTEELVIREIRINEAAGRGDSDSRMKSFEVIMPLKRQSTEIFIFST